MRRCLLALLLLTICAFSQEASTPPPTHVPEVALGAPPPLVLPAGKYVDLVVWSGASSETSKVGDLVKLEVLKPVVVEGITAIAAGTPVEAEVIAVDRRGRKGKLGSITLRFRSAATVLAQPVPLTGDQSRTGEDNRQQVRNDTAAIPFETLGFGLPIVPLIMLQKGGAAEIPAGARLYAVVANDVALDYAKAKATQPIPRTDLATIYVVNPFFSTCGSLRLPWALEGVVRLDLPPGEYWFHAGATDSIARQITTGFAFGFTFGAIHPELATVRNVLKHPLSEFLHVDAKAGDVYYLRPIKPGKKWMTESLESREAERALGDANKTYFILRDFTAEQLRALQARPMAAEPRP